MANTTTNGNAMPYIKTDPDEYLNDPNRFMMANPGYGSSQQNFHTSFGNQVPNNGVDPSTLSMQNGQYTFGQPGLSSSFNVGNAGFDDDELMQSLGHMDDFSHTNFTQMNSNHHPSTPSISHQGQASNAYSNTPEDNPIQSPFLQNFDYSQFRPFPQHMSPAQQAMYQKRPSLQAMSRKSSDQRGPLTPKTNAMAGLNLGTPESASLPNGRPIRTPNLSSRHQKTLSGQYDSTPGSIHSFLESPTSSPGHPSHHTGISEALGSGKHASLPAKVENGHATQQTLESVEAKKRRRRASHNAVERRRRDNINERIQDLSHLVPQHRLDDDRVRKQLQNNSPLSPSLGATSISPPNAATSLLAGASGRRAASTAGNITIGLPIEDKEKGPNKGDILNGSVSWTRDLMWGLHLKYMQEDELADYITSLGGTWPFTITDDEKRLRSEVLEAMEKNDVSSFSYSRTHGSGLRVPRHTNMQGEPLNGAQGGSNMSPQSVLELSPGYPNGTSSGGHEHRGSGSGNGVGEPQFWNSAGHPGISFKEEDEFMDGL